MVTVSRSIAVLLCLIYVPYLTSAFFRKPGFSKRFGEVVGSRKFPKASLYFKGDGFKHETVGAKYSSIVLECQAGGSPSPTIHWLKDGVRIQQGPRHSINDDDAFFEDNSQDALRISQTNSRLFIDCLSEEDAGKYTCVAESPTLRRTQSTKLTVVKAENVLSPEIVMCKGRRSGKGEPARIYMWSVSRLDLEGTKIQLFCRAEGFPTPVISWFDANNSPIKDNYQYKIERNGDLIINDITWMEHMGGFTCLAENALGKDSTTTFVYPTTMG